MPIITSPAFTQSDVNNLLQTYTNLIGRFELSSVLRERNRKILNAKEVQSDIPSALTRMIPYVPFILLIGPVSMQRTGWNPITQVQQTIDGAVLLVTPNAEFQTIRVSGTSGDLILLTQTERTPIFIDNAAVANLLVGTTSFNQTPQNSAITNQGFGTNFNSPDTSNVLSNFFNVLTQVLNSNNLKRQCYLLLKSWAEEPNIVSDGNETFHNLKKMRLFSTLYPPPFGKVVWGTVDGFSESMTADGGGPYRKVDWEFNFRIVKDQDNDFKQMVSNLAASSNATGNITTINTTPQETNAVKVNADPINREITKQNHSQISNTIDNETSPGSVSASTYPGSPATTPPASAITPTTSTPTPAGATPALSNAQVTGANAIAKIVIDNVSIPSGNLKTTPDAIVDQAKTAVGNNLPPDQTTSATLNAIPVAQNTAKQQPDNSTTSINNVQNAAVQAAANSISTSSSQPPLGIQIVQLQFGDFISTHGANFLDLVNFTDFKNHINKFALNKDGKYITLTVNDLITTNGFVGALPRPFDQINSTSIITNLTTTNPLLTNDFKQMAFDKVPIDIKQNPNVNSDQITLAVNNPFLIQVTATNNSAPMPLFLSNGVDIFSNTVSEINFHIPVDQFTVQHPETIKVTWSLFVNYQLVIPA